MSSERDRRPPTVEQLRDDIDSGRTGDKIAFPDPAAAPLGADDEAAGSPPTSDQIEEARRHERGRAARAASSGRFNGARLRSRQRVDAALHLLAAEIDNEPVPDRLVEQARRLQQALASRCA